MMIVYFIHCVCVLNSESIKIAVISHSSFIQVQVIFSGCIVRFMPKLLCQLLVGQTGPDILQPVATPSVLFSDLVCNCTTTVRFLADRPAVAIIMAVDVAETIDYVAL